MLGVNPVTGDTMRYITLQGKLDPGTKKIPKVYHLAVHPTQVSTPLALAN